MNLALWVFIDMIITLYKNCRLNKSYCEVLDTIAPHTYNGVEYANSLEAYLSTLPKKVFNTGTGTIYGTNSGKIPFELAQGEGLTMYDYNYMKIADETNNFVRYCFILSLQVADGSAIAEYEEDVWASYSATMHIRKSLLTRSRSLKYGNTRFPFYKLGMEYEGNNNISFNSLKTVYDPYDTQIGKCILVAKIQLYQLVRQGEVGNIVTRNVALKIGNTPYDRTEINQKLFSAITQLKKWQSIRQFGWNETYKTTYKIQDASPVIEWYYEISDFVLVPAKFNLSLNTNEVGFNMGTLVIDISGQVSEDEVQVIDIERSFTDLNSQFSNGRPILTTVADVTSDFKHIGIGTYSNTYEVVENGTDYQVSILISCDDFNFDIYLNLQNHLVNITENYRVEIPITVQSADVTQQQKTARQLEIMNSSLQMGHSVVQLTQGFMSLGIGQEYLNIAKNIGTKSAGIGNVSSGIGNIYGGLSTLTKGIANLVVANKPLYRTAKGTFARSIGISNAYYGLFLIEIVPDNTTEVQANIDNGGYVVNEVVDDLLQEMAIANDKPAYNVMQFDYINNYGAFPEDIRQRLVDILTNGFKIWYNTAEYIAS